eukprot:3868390-Karenia_brevis.AAC.1
MVASPLLDTLDGGGVTLRIFKCRLAVERWKAKKRDRCLAQKRQLAARPEYKAHRREMYRQKVDELKELGILPRAKGRPRLYHEGSQEALEARREKGRRASARYREKNKISQGYEKDEQSEQSTSEDASQISD